MSPRSRRNAVSYFNVMVVGFSGVGKTSFIKTLMAALNSEVSKDKRESFGSQPADSNALAGPLTKTLKPYTASAGIDVDGEKIMFTVIDTPGFQSDYLIDKQLHDILGYIEHQFDLTLAEESKVKRNPKAVDTQVHACLYVIDPTKRALDQYDIRILTRLAERVNVIPVVGKADTLTLAQRRRLKPTILRDIYTTQKIPLYGMPEDEEEDEEDDEEEEKTEEKQDNNNSYKNDDFLSQFNYEEEDEETQAFLDYLKLIPFSVIAYEDDPETGDPIEIEGIKIGRDYGWGKIDCLSDSTSDFNSLKTMLLSTHRRILQTETVERYYEQYRTERLLIKRATKLKSMDVGKKLLDDLNQLK
ncbi:Septin-domain-containing protein [Zychaea mexicana]|uniref:Septin-domain-containing protein n=1 Tax=Zychaea mexicana TaxID=64656 RepID=UPI0022FE2574|nr:Septin-domain-containing protein [Zychaea mexicana]KAI9484899.1 Septin-domain-containing protein [Zychaea mexicana]